MDESIKINVFKPDAIIKLEISSSFYNKLQQLLFALVSEKEPDIVVLTLKELETREPQNMWEHHVMIYLALIAAADEAAVAQDLFVKKDLSDIFPSSAEASPES